MKVTSYAAGGVTVLCPREAITQNECDEFKQTAFDGIASGRGWLMVDLSEVPFIDSVALEMMTELATRCRQEGGRLKLAALSENCEEIFRLTDLDTQLEVYESVEKAAKSMI